MKILLTWIQGQQSAITDTKNIWILFAIIILFFGVGWLVLYYTISIIHRPKCFILMSLHSSRVMFIKQIQIETRNKGGLLLLLAAAVATYIYCGYQSQLGMTQKAEKGQY